MFGLQRRIAISMSIALTVLSCTNSREFKDGRRYKSHEATESNVEVDIGGKVFHYSKNVVGVR